MKCEGINEVRLCAVYLYLHVVKTRTIARLVRPLCKNKKTLSIIIIIIPANLQQFLFTNTQPFVAPSQLF